MEDCCAVCAEPLEWLAYGPCGHREVCSICTARMRFIMEDKCCCICKQDCSTVFVTKALGDYTKALGDFNSLQAGANEGQVGEYWFHADTQAYFDDEGQYKMIKAMCRLCCNVCEKPCGPQDSGKDLQKRIPKLKNIDQLRAHLFRVHKLCMCTLCLEGRKVFVCEQKLYTQAQLKRHLSRGDSEVDGSEIERGGFMGHPMCDFCEKRFYGENELYMHMSTEHYTCHICQRRHPGHFDYYRNYNDLEAHFSQEHFLCENADCLAKKFVVFSSEAELKRHNATEHAGKMSRSQRNAACQIPVSFQYRRPGNERESHRVGRGRGRSLNDHLSAANQARIETTNQENAIHESTLSRTDENAGTTGESHCPISTSEVVAIPSNSTISNDPPRYLTAVSRSALNSPLQESAFPPLPGASENAGQNSNTNSQRPGKSMAALFRGGRGDVRVLNKTGSRHSVGLGQLSSSHSVNSSLIQTNNNRNINFSERAAMPNISGGGSRLSTVMNDREMLPNSDQFPPISGRQNAPTVFAADNQSGVSSNMCLLSYEETRAANKALIERIRSGLGDNEQQFAAFKDVSGQFRSGDIDARNYCAYVSQLGLSHLVPELARLCPEQQKQRELLEAHKIGLKKDLEHAVNQATNQVMAASIGLGNSDSRKKGKSIDDAGCREDVLYSSKDKSSDESEVLSKDGYRDAIKLKPWEKQSFDKVSGTSASSSNEAVDSSSLQVLARSSQRPITVPDTHISYSSDKWSCDACTLLNKPDSSHCLVCGTARLDSKTLKEPIYGGRGKQKKKTSKFQRARLGDSSATTESTQSPSVGGVWGNGGGQRLLSMSQREPPVDSVCNFRG